MNWSYPEISIEDLMKLIKNFIDMLMLASGYQSTGRLAHWDPRNITKCFQWALLLENVAKDLLSSVDYHDSVEQLDAGLHELTINPYFPQGLVPLSCVTLSRASDLLLKHLVHTLPLRESHLKAIMTSCVDMDLNKLKRVDSDCLDVYLERLMRVPSEGENVCERGNFMEVSGISSESGKHDGWVCGDFSVSTIQQIRRRQEVVSCLSAVENGLECLWKSIGRRMRDELRDTSKAEATKRSSCLIAEELPIESAVWNHWRSRSLSYMFDKRTIRMISGANLICSVPEGQWIQMFERLKMSAEADDLSETIELLLLGCIADKWSGLIEHLMSTSYESLTISRLYHEVFNLPLGKSLNIFLQESLINPKEKYVVNYLEELLSSQLNQLWKLSPVLAAVAVPSWSRLFRSYLGELEGQLKGNSMATRRCSCDADAVEHSECEAAERIWCLYIFHVRGSHALLGTTSVA